MIILLFWRRCLSKVELSSLKTISFAPLSDVTQSWGVLRSQSKTLRPLLQKAPLASPSPQVSSEWSEQKNSLQGWFLPFTQRDMNTHISLSAAYTDTLQSSAHSLQKSIFTCVFNCTSHMSKYSANLLEIIDSCRFDCSSILNVQSEIEKLSSTVLPWSSQKPCMLD